MFKCRINHWSVTTVLVFTRQASACLRTSLFHLDLGYSLHGLAWVLNHNGKQDEAEALSREEWAMRRKLLGNEHLDVAWTLCDLASFLRDQGKLSEAETTIRESLAIRRKHLKDGHPDITASFNQLTELLRAQGKPAEPLKQLALVDPRIHWQLGNKDEARRWHDRAVEWIENNAPVHEELIRFRAEASGLLGLQG